MIINLHFKTLISLASSLICVVNSFLSLPVLVRSFIILNSFIILIFLSTTSVFDECVSCCYRRYLILLLTALICLLNEEVLYFLLKTVNFSLLIIHNFPSRATACIHAISLLLFRYYPHHSILFNTLWCLIKIRAWYRLMSIFRIVIMKFRRTR